MDDRTFFDALAPIWDENEKLSTPEKIDEILDLIGINKGDAVLDLGTGTGVLLPYIATKIGNTGKITAVDFSDGMLERAKKKFSELTPKPEFLNLDFENETIPGEYQHILLYCVYPHLHTPVETIKWLQKVNLRPGGDIIIAFPCSNEFINNIHKERHSESGDLLSPSQLKEQLENNGIKAQVISDTQESYIVKITN